MISQGRPQPFRVVLRCAEARDETSEPDDWRALTPLGRLQANGIVGRLRGLGLMRVFTSPSLRCRQTVMPLARSLRVDVEPRAELALGADPRRLLAFLRHADTESAVLCTHREALGGLLMLADLESGPAIGIGHPVIRLLTSGFARL
jgi:phosphohistidine phosphatase SixA